MNIVLIYDIVYTIELNHLMYTHPIKKKKKKVFEKNKNLLKRNNICNNLIRITF